MSLATWQVVLIIAGSGVIAGIAAIAMTHQKKRRRKGT